ncbi:MAG TPA: response regulator transcription factor [Oceanospirillales bacterium]|nr:response regulator transcription factor [Oceanospirillales bacterium]
MNSVLIIEDLQPAMQWLLQSVQLAYTEASVSQAIDLESAFAQVKKQTFDLVLADIGLPDGSGLDVVEYLTQHSPQTLVVITTIFDDDQHVFSALRKGAKGYILKDQDKDQLAQMLVNIENGNLPISAAIANKLLNFFNPQIPNTDLTKREKEVLVLIAKGYKVPNVAELLGIKSSTCYGYVKDIYLKLDINSRAQATLAASKMGLIDYNIE